MYSNIGKSHPLEWASTILGVISIFVTLPIFYFYRNGKKIRERSKFAQEIEMERRQSRMERTSRSQSRITGDAAAAREKVSRDEARASHRENV
jgi:hypothetical protein